MNRPLCDCEEKRRRWALEQKPKGLAHDLFYKYCRRLVGTVCASRSFRRNVTLAVYYGQRAVDAGDLLVEDYSRALFVYARS